MSKWTEEVADKKLAADKDAADDSNVAEGRERSKPQPVYNRPAPVNAWENARTHVNVEPRRPCCGTPPAPYGRYCGKMKGL